MKDFKADLAAYNGTVLDVSESTRAFFKQHPRYTFWMWAVVIALEVVLAYSGFVYFNWKSVLVGEDAELVLILLFLPFLIPIISYGWVSARMQKLFFTQLAEVLGMTYAPSAGRDTVSGYFFNVGSGGIPSNVLSGSYENAPIRLFEYQFTTGSGKHQQTHRFVVSEIDAQGPLPHVFMKPEHSAVFGKPSGTKLLSLEGNFNDHFDVYVPEDSEIEALQILEPDVMLKLIEEFPSFGFECFGTKTYVFQPGTFANNREELTQSIKLLERLYDELLPELKSFTRSR